EAFGEARRGGEGTPAERGDPAPSIHSADPEGLAHELLVVDVDDEPLIADHPEVPAEVALQGFHAVRAYSAAPDASRSLFEALEFEPTEKGGGGWEARGFQRGGLYLYDDPPQERALQGAGSVHH